MAIPFVMPSDDDAGEQGQRLEQLMLDLYAALQQVLRSRAAQHASRNQRDEQSTTVLYVVMRLVTCYDHVFLNFSIWPRRYG
ncbi:hypothetical protein K0M31_017846 [Melipona bicolor]|uniref:Uncharacterized protein n=1 Tax=Melipona bicolor TaxID=60889 RepID=A0AA40G5Q0_9HYME|nr:hypothetical protein K0M31_017846 [Melipona bicolor]